MLLLYVLIFLSVLAVNIVTIDLLYAQRKFVAGMRIVCIV